MKLMAAKSEPFIDALSIKLRASCRVHELLSATIARIIAPCNRDMTILTIACLLHMI